MSEALQGLSGYARAEVTRHGLSDEPLPGGYSRPQCPSIHVGVDHKASRYSTKSPIEMVGVRHH